MTLDGKGGGMKRPKFGDRLRGIHASEGNPRRDGMYVETVYRRGRLNPGEWYRITDGKGNFWMYRPEDTILLPPPEHNPGRPSCASKDARIKQLEEALNINREDVARIMHESWTRTKRSQGFHHPGEVTNDQRSRYHGSGLCDKCHADLIPWDDLHEKQKDINRHAFDDVLAELRRRANEGGKG